MASLEERMAMLEGRVHDQAAFIAVVHTTGGELRQAMAELRSELRGEIGAVRTEISELRAELRAELAEVRTELRAELAEARTELRAELAEVRAGLRGEIAALRSDMDHRFGEVNARLGLVEQRFDRLDRNMAWLVGLVVTATLASLGSVASAFWAVARTQ
jgi:uncharacterized protein involved in exopolysaccharide biosynthesis